MAPNYALGNMAVSLAGSRYLGELKRLISESEKSDSVTLSNLLASTYLRGVYDMACLYLGTTNGDDLADHLKRIDARVMTYESGGYEDGADDEPDA